MESYLAVDGGVVQFVQGGSVGGLDGHDVPVVVQPRQRFPREVPKTFGVFCVVAGGHV